MQVALKTLKMHSFSQALFCSLSVTVDQSKMPGQGHEVRVSAQSENCGTFFLLQTNKCPLPKPLVYHLVSSNHLLTRGSRILDVLDAAWQWDVTEDRPRVADPVISICFISLGKKTSQQKLGGGI